MNWIQVKTRDNITCTINVEKIVHICRDTVYTDEESRIITKHTHDEIMDAIKRANLGTRIAVV